MVFLIDVFCLTFESYRVYASFVFHIYFLIARFGRRLLCIMHTFDMQLIKGNLLT